MSTPVQAQTRIEAPQTHIETAGTVPRWGLATRIAFRFCFVYFSLFSILGQFVNGMIAIPNVDVPSLEFLWPTRQIVFWTAAHVFRVKSDLVTTDSGSGDKIFDWVLVALLLVVAIVTAAIWSVLDRKRENYVTLHKWFRLFMRFALGSEMLIYGLAKVIPVQMPAPSLSRLVEPFGNLSPMGVLWASIGSARAYEIFAGSAETLGGVLVMVPRTATLGALVCLADMIQVFMLNMTYDVPVKLLSFHLILVSVFLLAPELGRLANFFLLNRTAEASSQPPVLRTARANRIAVVVQLVFGMWLAGNYIYSSCTSWYRWDGAPKPALYGIWNVEQLTIDGQVRPPLLTDQERWRRAIFGNRGTFGFQRMDDSFVRYNAQINDQYKTIAMTDYNDKNWKGNLAFLRANPNELTLDGTMGSHKVHMQLRLVDRNSFLLVSRGFHWVQEQPFNR